jgi:hypothetical protein
MLQALRAPAELVAGRVLYVGDRPMPLGTWVDAFAVALTGRPAKRVPRVALRALALMGDALGLAGLRFPLTSSRFRSMTENYPTPMEPTFAAFGEPPFTLEAGVQRTVVWLEARGTGR